ncbi:hydrolase [Alishewanella sp. 16-MA]|uniref:Hydrolase n=1 Tax=Alishewanella maricola TaxID=2795740 RepID=A0ABS8C4I6_9ALTE|nr:hydrolase [Alishewanella maricola]MCB5227237.1 hydrolase [Alishewanella maricola]
MQAQIRPVYTSSFKAPWWLKHAHLQTIFAKYLSPKARLSSQAELFTLSDGDELQLNWTELPKATDTRPLVVLLHGLAGNIDSHYIQGLLTELKQRNWPAVLMHFRGCHGQPNKLPRAYHSGDTGDFAEVITQIQQRFPLMPISAVGFSLGANVLVKYCGEQGGANLLKAAVAICPPLALSASAKRINSGSSKVYQRYLLSRLKASTEQKLASHANFPLPLTLEQIRSFSSIEQFDQHYTAPIHGFRDAQDYYQKASGKAFLRHIQIPTLVIHAHDDPFLSDAVIPKPTDLSASVHYELSQHGGHVGFVTGSSPFKPVFWLNQRIPAFIKQQLNL